MKVSRSGHSLRAASEGRQGSNNSPDSDMPEDLGDEEMAEGVGTIAFHTLTKGRQP